MVEMRDNGPEAKAIHERADASTSRSVYLPLLRGVIPHTLEAFDPVEQTLVTGRRETTTVPGQALYLLNASSVRRQSLALAERLSAQPPLATSVAKQLVDAVPEASGEAVLALERLAYAALAQTDEHAEATRAFMER